MRLEIHYRIAQAVCAELRGMGLNLHQELFHFGNLFPDLIHSYFWLPHEYPVSRDYISKKLTYLKQKPLFFSFHLGVLTHYICDYFCYPHSRVCNKNLIHHIIYELRQKAPQELCKLKLNSGSFTIEELDKFVDWYELFRPLFSDDHEQDFRIATLVSSHFLQAAY
jgi:hypothetical protein